MRTFFLAALILTASFLTGCMRDYGLVWQRIDNAIAVMQPTEGNTANGIVYFLQQSDSVLVVFDIKGLEPGSTHAIHVHEFGDLSTLDAMSAGGHYNPEDHPHGLPPGTPRHAGDLGNITSDANGRALSQMRVYNMSVAEISNPVVGRALILHAKHDTGEQPVGNAGPRIAHGVIGVANPTSLP